MRGSLFCLLILFAGCSKPESSEKPKARNTLFQKLSSDVTGISFINELKEQEDFDVFRYRNYYNGGGVGIADFNNDGLVDIYLTSNMGDNKLYRNKGNWKFEDITTSAGVKGQKVWSTGVSIADVNGDGLLDIYVCNAGDVKGGKRENELFINNGNFTFTDRAEEYGLADRGFSTHAAFFDFDKDGDLDCYVLNNSYRPVSSLGYRNLRQERDQFGGHKLYLNDDGHYRDISKEAGIYGSVIGFGLGVTVGDVNQDQWPDLYISNDFYERDYLYINNQKGGFDEQLESYMGHISMFSMGADLADLTNDGYPEIFSTDMLPEDDYRLKTLVSFETYDTYKLRLQNGYYHQYMRNMLQLNNGNGTFSEIGLLAGVAATDWSWGALIADFNNDQYKEIFVSNGIYKDVIDQDFVEYLGSSEQIKSAIHGKKVDFQRFVEKMPSTKISNYLFERQAPLKYKNVAADWGLDEPGFSNGSAYGDLDNDGDLDLIVNNVNMEAFVYRNQTTDTLHANYLGFTFKGKDKNVFGLGTNVRVYVNDQILAYDHMPIRGFQSSMDYKMIVGLGKNQQADSVVVTWPDQSTQWLYDVKANQVLAMSIDSAKGTVHASKGLVSLLKEVKTDSIYHHENAHNDFDNHRLLYHMLSTQGPAFAKSDLNKDGMDDLFIGGSIGEAAKLYMAKPNQRYEKVSRPFDSEKSTEDVDAVFFDADNDGDDDLYVVTGGLETPLQSPASADRFFLNKGLTGGAPVYESAPARIPALYQSGSCVRAKDFDNDGDIDLFVGTRVNPSYYGTPCDQYLLVNDGSGNFKNLTATMAPEFAKLGMVTDAAWFDYDANGFSDLLVVGEWMPVTVFLNDGKKLVKKTDATGSIRTDGWWNSIKQGDLDGDGDVDFVLGNLGLNSKFKPSQEHPVSLLVNDFDRNGSTEPIFAFERNGSLYPFALRQEIIKQMSSVKKKFLFYKDYANKSLPDIFDADLLEKATKLSFYESRTSLLINNGKAGLELKPLPIEAQFAPVYGTELFDIDSDGDTDIILGGNLFSVKPEIGRYDALAGMALINQGSNNFTAMSSGQSGIGIKGEVRHIALLKGKKGSTLAFVRNNDSMVFYQSKK